MTTEAPGHELQRCIAECELCHRTCLHLIFHCLGKGGAHAEPGHIRLLLDCAAICRTSADFMVRTSDLHGLVCGVCAEICDRCAQDCDRFEKDTEMQNCASTCRRCAELCRQMAHVPA